MRLLTLKSARRFAGAIAGLAVAGMVTAASAVTISGAGATFPAPIYLKWASAYEKATGNKLNYGSIGSGGGIAQIKAKTVTFGASDAPLSAADLDEVGLAQWPMVMGGIVPVVNLPGITPGQIVLDGKTVADIFLGKIKKWNDPAIKALNPGVGLPNMAILVVHRSDGSGTTFNFTYYLSDVSPEWKSKVGTQKAVEWPTGVGAKGNEGVAGGVGQTVGSIGYVEYAYAKQNKLTYTDMINKDGKRVQPTSPSFAAAAANADWQGTPGYAVILANQPGAGTWPMTAATFILMYKDPKNVAASNDALKFFDWCFANGDDMAGSLDYIPMPSNVVKSIEAMWKSDIKGWNGAGG